ncbi:SDR family oxidoreductase [Sphingobium tyrosinilyticum]|uniref:SDR family oxidoreductase n=1 Tax=Sphingobium tyrosinilyticum TaxID=2715436 RepID=A0ABV9F1F9_9SPHN
MADFKASPHAPAHRAEKPVTALSDRHVVVIAGSSGIGLAVAAAAAERGARVTVTGRDAARLAKAAAAIGRGTDTVVFDGTDGDEVARFFSKIGHIDHLVSCIGFSERGTLLGHAEEQARRVIEHKFWAQLRIVRQGLPVMSRDGSITLTGGTAADRAGVPHFAAFSIIGNTALGALVQGLAAEIAPVRINVVEPTVTNTPLMDILLPEQKASFFARFSATSPIGRVPQPQQVARSYIHAMESDLINGDRLRPDGGPTLVL